MKYYFVLLLFFLASCLSTDLSPESALKDFVDSRIGKVVDKDFVMERVTGKMLQSFENMAEEDFKKFADMQNIKANSFKILSKSCQENKCFVTYSVGYITKSPENKTVFSSEVKKIAEMIKIENKWLIADVSNLKTYHEKYGADKSTRVKIYTTYTDKKFGEFICPKKTLFLS